MKELIITKIIPPRRRPDLIARPRLLHILQEQDTCRLVVVSAPAGYGKTSLLIDYVHRLDHPVCWYTLTESDTNLWTFATYLVGSIRQQIPTFGERTLQYIEQEGDDHDPVVTTLVNELYAQPHPITLVLDDFYFVDDSPAIKAFLAALILWLPDNCRMIIASRTVPDFDPRMVSRLLAQRDIVGLGHDDLRFTPEEVQDFLAAHAGTEVPLERAKALAAMSEGWITAIILMSQVDDPLSGIVRARRAGGRLYDYLAAEVIHQLPEATQTFLMESAVLTEMDPSMVNTLLGIENAGTILEMLEAQNISLTRLEGWSNQADTREQPRVWYRYHPLLREFLQMRLQAVNLQRFRDLQDRAARMLLEAGYVDQAIDHFLRAGAYAEAADVIEAEASGMLKRARADLLVRWIDALPDGILERCPRLLRFRANISTERDGDPVRAIELCEKAEALLDRNQASIDLARVLLEKATALRMLGRFHEVIRCCESALNLAGGQDPSIAADAQRDIGLAHVQLGHLQTAVAALRSSLDYWQDTDNTANCALVCNDLGTVLRTMGDLTASERYFRRALEIWETLADSGRAAMTLNNVALGYHYQGKYHEALQEYARALERAKDAASRRYSAYIQVGMGDVYRDLACCREAIESYKEGLLNARRVGDAFLGAYTMDAMGQSYHYMGNTREGIALVRRAYEDARERGAKYEVALYQLSLGIIAHEEGFVDEAISQLRRCVAYFSHGHRRELARAKLHLAQTCHLAYRPQEMREYLREAELCLLQLGYDGFILPTVLRTAGAIRAGSEVSPYLRKLLDLAEAKLGPIPEAARQQPVPALRVHLFGKPRVYLGNVPLSGDDWNRQRAQELFFYLLMHPNRTTQQIGADLWPDLSPSRVRNNVYVTMSYLRRMLGNPDFVVQTDGRYSLQVPRLWIDVRRFLEAVELARSSPNEVEEIRQWERAVGIYSGDFLEDFSVTSEDAWIREERSQLQRLYEQALDRLVGYWLEHNDDQRADRYMQLHSELIARRTFAA